MSNIGAYSPCASWARELAVSPAGTAPQFDVLVLVEHPLPWPRDIGADPGLRHLADVAAEHAASGRTVRLQAAATDPKNTTRRVVVFDRGEGGFAGYGRTEGSASVGDLEHLVAELVSARVPSLSSLDVTDVLICTHGTRDRCCGSMGTRLWMAAERRLPGVHLWRTSHTGGHRFAPTAMTFPEGGCWAHLDEEVLFGLVDRTLPAVTAATHLRGCTAFEPSLQVADREVFASRGWEWLACTRFGNERGPNRVELSFETPIGERGTYDVLLEHGRELPVPDCGRDPNAASKLQTELKVAQLRLRI